METSAHSGWGCETQANDGNGITTQASDDAESQSLAQRAAICPCVSGFVCQNQYHTLVRSLMATGRRASGSQLPTPANWGQSTRASSTPTSAELPSARPRLTLVVASVGPIGPRIQLSANSAPALSRPRVVRSAARRGRPLAPYRFLEIARSLVSPNSSANDAGETERRAGVVCRAESAGQLHLDFSRLPTGRELAKWRPRRRRTKLTFVLCVFSRLSSFCLGFSFVRSFVCSCFEWR